MMSKPNVLHGMLFMTQKQEFCVVHVASEFTIHCFTINVESPEVDNLVEKMNQAVIRCQ